MSLFAKQKLQNNFTLKAIQIYNYTKADLTLNVWTKSRTYTKTTNTNKTMFPSIMFHVIVPKK